jgi:hypothetical protein
VAGGEDRERFRIRPVVDDLRQDVDVPARGDRNEEVPTDDSAAVGHPLRPQHLVRASDDLRAVEEDAAQAGDGRQEPRQEPALPATNVAARPDARQVASGEEGLGAGGRAPAHGGVEECPLLRVGGEVIPEADAVDAGEGRLARAHCVRQLLQPRSTQGAVIISTKDRAESGTSERTALPSGVKRTPPAAARSHRPKATRDRKRRPRLGACAPVSSARSSAVRDPVARWSASPRTAIARTAWEVQ